MKFRYNDGGRQEAGYKGITGDCAVRAIAIATNISYQKVYNDINELSKQEKVINKKRSNSRTGVSRKIINQYLESLGWKWVSCKQIGEGCKTHLKASELPKENIICRLSKHCVAVINGVINDTYDCSRNETRCVYGYWIAK